MIYCFHMNTNEQLLYANAYCACVTQDTLVETLRRSRLHFVHCLLPQASAGLSELRTSQLAPNQTVTSEDLMVNVPLVRQQVRGVELIEAIRIHRQGQCRIRSRSCRFKVTWMCTSQFIFAGSKFKPRA